MRLCLISHAYIEYSYRYTLEALASHPDVELAWLTPNRYRLALQNSSGELSETSQLYKTYPLPIHWGGRQGTFVYHRKPLLAALNHFQPDIILHEQEVFALGGWQIAQIATKRKVPLAMFVNENLYRELSLPRRWLRSYVLKRCTGLIPISSDAAKVHRDWGFHGPIAILAQIGLRLNPKPVYGHRRPGILRVFFAGRLVHIKGVDCLLRAIAILHTEGVPVTCKIAGRGENHDQLIALSDELGIGAVVEFVGMLSPVAMTAHFQQSDVLVLPSRRTKVWEEQFGRVLVEAMAQATVTTGSNTGAIWEVIGSPDLLFEEDDFAQLACILTRLAQDEVFFQTHQRRLWERVRDHYELQVVTQRKIDFLKQLIEQSRALY